MPNASKVGNGEEKMESQKDPEISPENIANKVKMVIFKSYDKGLSMPFKAGFIERTANGMGINHPSEVIHFMDNQYLIEDIPANAKIIRFLRTHPSNGITFSEVPTTDGKLRVPSIEELERMSMTDLRELCKTLEVTIRDGSSKELIMIEILKRK